MSDQHLYYHCCNLVSNSSFRIIQRSSSSFTCAIYFPQVVALTWIGSALWAQILSTNFLRSISRFQEAESSFLNHTWRPVASSFWTTNCLVIFCGLNYNPANYPGLLEFLFSLCLFWGEFIESLDRFNKCELVVISSLLPTILVWCIDVLFNASS